MKEESTPKRLYPEKIRVVSSKRFGVVSVRLDHPKKGSNPVDTTPFFWAEKGENLLPNLFVSFHLIVKEKESYVFLSGLQWDERIFSGYRIPSYTPKKLYPEVSFFLPDTTPNVLPDTTPISRRGTGKSPVGVPETPPALP